MRGELTINLAALRENYQTLEHLSRATCETAAVVKADAYGLGVAHVAPALYQAGARRFFVATLDEGIELRGMIPPDSWIYILNGFWGAEKLDYTEHKLTPVLNDLAQVNSYAHLAGENDRNLPAILHFDIGMNRLGIPAAEMDLLLNDRSVLDRVDVAYIMGHLSSSEESENPTNERQRQRFEAIATHFPTAKKCLSNSGGVFLGGDFHYDLTRPGIALYGCCANKEMVESIKPVISLQVPVLQIHDGVKGETTGYNETFHIQENSKLAILPIGYADGLLRSLGNAGALYYNGCKLSILGRVSMDLVICDLKAVPEENFPRVGDMVEVIGDHQAIDDLATAAGTISYEILTNLGARYVRKIMQ